MLCVSKYLILFELFRACQNIYIISLSNNLNIYCSNDLKFQYVQKQHSMFNVFFFFSTIEMPFIV